MLTPVQLYRNVTMTRVHVEPVTPSDPQTQWMVIERTTWGCLISDLRRYSLRVALFNLAVNLGFIRVPASDEVEG